MPWNCLCTKKKNKQPNNESGRVALCRKNRSSQHRLLSADQNGQIINSEGKGSNDKIDKGNYQIISKESKRGNDEQDHFDYYQLRDTPDSLDKNDIANPRPNLKLSSNEIDKNTSDLDKNPLTSSSKHSTNLVGIELDSRDEKLVDERLPVDETTDRENVKINNKNYGNYDEIPYDSSQTGMLLNGLLTHEPILLCEESKEIPYIDADARSKSSASSSSLHEDQFRSFIKSFELEDNWSSKPEDDPDSSHHLNTVLQGRIEPTGSIESDTVKLQKKQTVFVDHHFEQCQFPKDRHCQLCHELIKSFSVVLRCNSCELTCHECCVVNMPNIRYFDISFIIFRKWLQSQEKYACPTLHRYNCAKKLQELSTDQTETQSVCGGSAIIGADNAVLESKRLRSQSLNHRSSNLKLEPVKDGNGTPAFTNDDIVRLRITESNRNTSSSDQSSKNSQIYLNPTDVVVDVHHAPNCLLLERGDSNVRQLSQTKDNVPGKRESRGDSPFAENSSSRRSGSFERNVSDSEKLELRRTKNQNDSNAQSDEYQYFPRSQSYPVSTKNHRQPFDSLRLHYVTQRILASILPKREQHEIKFNGGIKDKYEKEIISMLEQKHGMNYRVFDLESCLSVITLERICELCKHIDSWLGEDQEKVVVLQDREDRQRLGVAIAAYLEYLSICSSNFSVQKRHQNEDICVQNTIERNWLDLDVFSMKKFLEDFIGPLEIPSHRRYLKYFTGLLSGKIRMNSSPVHLKRITIESPPAWMKYGNQLASQLPEWMTFIKIYEGLRCIYTSDIHIIPVTTRQFLFEIGNLRLRGDILIRCYHVIPFEKRKDGGYSEKLRETFFSAQFHTCAISGREVIFERTELDLDSNDARFPSDLKVMLHISDSASDVSDIVFQSPLIRTKSPTEVAKYDSIDNLDAYPSCHTQGPIDGSLYATILKSPKSPQEAYTYSKTSTKTSQRQRESLGQCLLSPPPQFSNQEQPPVQPPRHDSVEKSVALYATTGRNVSAQRETRPTPSQSKVLRRNDSAETRYNTLQSNYPENSNKYIIPVNFNSADTRDITITETYSSTSDATSNQPTNREYAHSPLTLSMDSGISSNGVLNRPHQGSSVSPSSFPSQASPQEDRHRELDDILSDMLMTVQDIPDFSKLSTNQNQRPHYPIVRSQSVIPTSGNYALPAQLQSGSQYSTIQRSQSYVVEPTAVHKHPAYIQKEYQDIYDTSSTATTLTPPPSETGRDTPVAAYHPHPDSSGNYSTLQYHQKIRREKRETTGSPASHQQLIMSLRQQSPIEPLQVRTDTVSASEDDEIPYHAREHSQPFSYGNVPASSSRQDASPDDPAMIKSQSGLSSPSLVRKTLGRSPSPSSPAYRKTAQRVDFEEMLRDRREKVMSEKYSISDRSDVNNYPDGYPRPYASENQWANRSTLSRNQGLYSQDLNSNYRQSFEPLRRSNTMDGFHRSFSTDGISGQTWLQMQQQKLRAKKDQQHRDDRRYFEEVVQTEIRSRPFRSRANVTRFDGYASDTAAFTDEVDFRRPLQVQTRQNQNRMPADIYQTKTITATTTKERPFVAVRRAHEQSKHNVIGSPPLSPLTVLSSSPHGHISQLQQPHHQQLQNGLLSMANNSHDGHVRLENENLIDLESGQSGNQFRSRPFSPYSSFNITSNHLRAANIQNSLSSYKTGAFSKKTKKDSGKSAWYLQHDQNGNVNGGNLSPLSTLSSRCDHAPLDRIMKPLVIDSKNDDKQLDNNHDIGIWGPIEDNVISSSGDVHEHIYKNEKGLELTSLNLSDVLADLTEYTRYEELIGPPHRASDHVERSNMNGYGIVPAYLVLNSGQKHSFSIPPSLSEASGTITWSKHQAREESFSSYRSETDPELSFAGSPRPETPAFPVTPRTPYGLSGNGNVSPALPPKSPTSLRKDLYTGNQKGHLHEVVNQNDTISCYASRRNSNASNANSEPQEVAPHLVKFVRDSSKFWYKPNISREEAVALLRRADPGTFIVRDSTTYKNAFGLVLRVAHAPPGVELKTSTGDELVRHFLVEPTARGVRLKGCNNEPVFTSLSALVYQHSITPLALPCRLIIPEQDIRSQDVHSPAQRQLLNLGAACNVLHIFTCDTESLTGEEAIRKAVSSMFWCKPLPVPTEVHFKAAQQGVTLTDNTRQKFFRKHYPANSVSFCGLDPEKRTWSIPTPGSNVPISNRTIFAFVARRTANSKDNQCHVFCDLQPNQPALAIVSFVNKMLPTEKQVNYNI